MDENRRSDHDDALRASDADRERTADALREHHAAGRLTDEEFQERLDRSLAAKTIAELKVLVSDLPPGEPDAAHHPRRRPRCLRPLVFAVPVLLFVLLPGIVGHSWHSDASTGHHWTPWPLLALVLAVLLVRGRGRWRAHRSCGHPREA